MIEDAVYVREQTARHHAIAVDLAYDVYLGIAEDLMRKAIARGNFNIELESKSPIHREALIRVAKLMASKGYKVISHGQFLSIDWS